MLYTNIPGKEDYLDDNTPPFTEDTRYENLTTLIRVDIYIDEFLRILSVKRIKDPHNEFWVNEHKSAVWFLKQREITRHHLEMYVLHKTDISENRKKFVTNIIYAAIEQEKWEAGREERRRQGVIKAEAKRKIIRALKKAQEKN